MKLSHKLLTLFAVVAFGVFVTAQVQADENDDSNAKSALEDNSNGAGARDDENDDLKAHARDDEDDDNDDEDDLK